MKKEKSCGCVVVNNGKVLLVKHNAGHISFPKGHVELGETEQETAIREVKEETNIDVKIISDTKFIESYWVSEEIYKDVIYFLAIPTSFDMKNQESEVSEVLWVDESEILDVLAYDDTKKLWLDIEKEKKKILCD